MHRLPTRAAVTRYNRFVRCEAKGVWIDLFETLANFSESHTRAGGSADLNLNPVLCRELLFSS